MNKSIEARKAARKHREDVSTANVAANPSPAWGTAEEAAERAKREAAGAAEDKILEGVFGDNEFVIFTTGYNGGEAAGKAYNEFLKNMGFTEMETDMYKKPVEAFGPKLHIREQWKQIGRVKGNIGTSTFYRLKSDDKVVVLQTAGGDKGIRTIYVAV